MCTHTNILTVIFHATTCLLKALQWTFHRTDARPDYQPTVSQIRQQLQLFCKLKLSKCESLHRMHMKQANKHWKLNDIYQQLSIWIQPPLRQKAINTTIKTTRVSATEVGALYAAGVRGCCTESRPELETVNKQQQWVGAPWLGAF